MTAAEFDYELPEERIAQSPLDCRDQSRLMVFHRTQEKLEHRQFTDLPQYLRAGDVLVLNDSKVVRARLRGRNATSGGAFELLLVEENATNDWWVMLRPGRRAHLNTRIDLLDRRLQLSSIHARVIETNEEGHRRLRFEGTADIKQALDGLGEVPVPPYVRRTTEAQKEQDATRYQTVYAQAPGSVAAPTAGLHFTKEFLAELRTRGVEIVTVTLHVGLGTFGPVKVDNLADHRMHEERYWLSKETTRRIAQAKSSGHRVFAVGTTSLRTLESSQSQGALIAGEGRTRLFIHPPYHFAIADALLTNFHLPRSTLLMLVSAFASPEQMSGRDRILTAYREAIQRGYRFFSYGDAMLLL